MDRAQLAARIQEILKSRPTAGAGQGADLDRAGTISTNGAAGAAAVRGGRATAVDFTDEAAAFAARCAQAEAASRVLEVLGATLQDDGTGPSLVVDRHFPVSQPHGRHAVERYHRAARRSQPALSCFLGRSGLPAQRDLLEEPAGIPPLLFFDLETTGLSGGAGTYAFLVGFGFFDEDGFSTRQFFLRGYGEEHALLRAVEREVAGRSASGDLVLVTYNGRGFDIPLIETRYQMNRLRSPFDGLAHIDMLFPARRLWRKRALYADESTPSFDSLRPSTSSSRLDPAERRSRRAGGLQAASRRDEPPGSCALTALERDILGLHRQGDVPGWEIPARYFGYARTGDASGLQAVFEHNRLDLISLAAVSAVIMEMAHDGAGVERSRPDSLALARLLEHLGREDDAERCCCRAARACDGAEGPGEQAARADALYWLALRCRRARRFVEAADAWRELADLPGLDSDRRREALEALAIHHEHRAKDLEAARAFAVSALKLAGDAKSVDEMRHRLGRLSRKIGEENRPCSSLRRFGSLSAREEP
jgi:uncharacterized protein